MEMESGSLFFRVLFAWAVISAVIYAIVWYAVETWKPPSGEENERTEYRKTINRRALGVWVIWTLGALGYIYFKSTS